MVLWKHQSGGTSWKTECPPSEAWGLSRSLVPSILSPSFLSCPHIAKGPSCSSRIFGITEPWNEQRAGISPLFVTPHTRREEQQGEHLPSPPMDMREPGGWKRLGIGGIQTSPSSAAPDSPSFPVHSRIPLHLFVGACSDTSRGAFWLDYDAISLTAESAIPNVASQRRRFNPRNSRLPSIVVLGSHLGCSLLFPHLYLRFVPSFFQACFPFSRSIFWDFCSGSWGQQKQRENSS